MKRTMLATVAATALLGATNAAAQAQRTPTSPPKFTAAQLTAPPVAGWFTNGGNVYNQRYSPLALINRSNVSRDAATGGLHHAQI